MKKQNKKSDLAIPFATTMATLGITAMLGGILGKMFGLNDEKTPQKLAEEMMAGAVRGILEHFEYKLDTQKRDIERLIEEKTKLEDERDNLQEQLKEKSPKTTPKSKK